MINKEKLFEIIGKIFLVLALVCGLILFVCACIIPLADRLIYFIGNTTFSPQDLVAIIVWIGCILSLIVGSIFISLSQREEEKKRLEHEFEMQFEKKGN